MKASRITALGLVAAAGAVDRVRASAAARERAKAAPRSGPARARPRSCSASPSSRRTLVPHSRKLVLSGRTEADKQGDASRRAPAAS